MALWPWLAIGVVLLVGMISQARAIGRRRVEAELAIRMAGPPRVRSRYRECETTALRWRSTSASDSHRHL